MKRYVGSECEHLFAKLRSLGFILWKEGNQPRFVSSILTVWALEREEAYCEGSAEMDWLSYFRFVSCIMELIAYFILLFAW